MYMLVSIASALVSVYACMLGCMCVCELGGSFAGGSPSLAAIHQFGLPACFPPDWFAARNDQTWKLFEVFHCKLRFSEHYGEFVLGGRSLLVFAGNRCEWMASAQNDCSAYSCSRFLSTWTPVSKVAAATGNILSGSEYNYVSCLI